MRNKYEIFAIVIISTFIIGLFLIGPEYTGFAILEGGEKIRITEAIYDGENVTEDLIYLDGEYVEVVTNKSLSLNFSEPLEDSSLLNMFLSFEKDNSSMIIYDINNITAGYIDPYEFYPNETIVEEVKWYNETLNLSSPQNKLFIEITEEAIFDYIEAITTTTTTSTTTTTTSTTTTTTSTTTTSTTTTTIPPSGSESESGSTRPGNVVFTSEREKEEEHSEEVEPEEKTESENIIKETKTAPEIQAEVVRETKEEPFIGEAENPGLFKTVSNTFVESIKASILVKLLIVSICIFLLFKIYHKNRIKHNKKRTKKH